MFLESELQDLIQDASAFCCSFPLKSRDELPTFTKTSSWPQTKETNSQPRSAFALEESSDEDDKKEVAEVESVQERNREHVNHLTQQY